MSESPASSTSESVQDEVAEEDFSMLPLPWSVVAIICIVLAIATAVGGNVLVLLSYRRDRQLRSVHNLYLLNMAVSDLFIGAVSMPFYIVYTTMYWTWPFGAVVCKIFLVEDFTMCGMSVFCVVLVAWDRLALVQNGARYSIVETKRKAYVKLAVCWTFSFLLYSPAIAFWDVVRGYSVVPADDCDVEFGGDFEFTVTTEIMAFAVPFLSLSLINVLLFLALRKGRKVIGHTQQESRKNQPNQPSTQVCTLGSTKGPQSSLTTCTREVNFSDRPSSSQRKQDTSGDFRTNTEPTSCTAGLSTHSTQSTVVKMSRGSRGRRAGIILVLLVVALVVCWLPYSVSTILLSACDACVDKDLYEFFVWLLWVKSCINPFLYAYNSPRFRKNFLEILARVFVKCQGGREVATQDIDTVSPRE
ncbi:hypothetical protein BaRGS_00020966 [Batillaria attramentaria]|uniref:G-protein coupled receptors family 1 profile domain-containing protein n=1 Tax=Batillaria attramentaria TaxID=370345 RepID=A0ABD0KKI2_9CAEN